MAISKFIPMSIDSFCDDLTDPVAHRFTHDILQSFVDNGFSYLVSCSPGRVYCYIKKSKECLIINKPMQVSGGDRKFNIQLRILNPDTFKHLNELSPRVRDAILNGRNCKGPDCSNCHTEYRFMHEGISYAKCHMLCDNFYLKEMTMEDYPSVMRLIENEMRMDRRWRQRNDE